MKQSIILGIGTGRCGLASLAKILNQQPDTQCSYEDSPLLPWKHIDAERVLEGDGGARQHWRDNKGLMEFLRTL
jgi:hypothetical protein